MARKRFVLYPPWEWKNLYPFPRIHPRWHKSQVKYDEPDLEKVPRYRQATAYEVNVMLTTFLTIF